jgi:hypothetical protein
MRHVDALQSHIAARLLHDDRRRFTACREKRDRQDQRERSELHPLSPKML